MDDVDIVDGATSNSTAHAMASKSASGSASTTNRIAAGCHLYAEERSGGAYGCGVVVASVAPTSHPTIRSPW